MSDRPYPELDDANFQRLLDTSIPRILLPELLARLWVDGTQQRQAMSLLSNRAYTTGVAGRQEYALKPEVRRACLAYLETSTPGQYEEILKRVIEAYLALAANGSDAQIAVYDQELAHHLEVLCSRMLGSRTPELALLLQKYKPGPHLDRSQRTSYYFQSFPLERQAGKLRAIAHLEAVITLWPIERITARAYNSLGLFFSLVNRFDAAQAALDQALSICEQLGEETQDIYPKVLTNLGLLARRLGKYELARTWAQKRLALAEATADLYGQGVALHNLGYAEHLLGLWEDAEQHYRQALSVCRRQGDRQGEGQAYLNLGEVMLLQGKFATAESHLQTALAIMLDEKEQDRYDAADVLVNMGFLHFVQGQYTAADTAYNEALRYLSAIKGERTLLEARLRLQIGNLALALDQPHLTRLAYANAIAIYEKVRTQERTEETRISMMGIGQHMYQTMIQFCIDQGDRETAFAYVEKAKARSFLDMLRFEAVKPASPDLAVRDTDEIRRHLPPNTVLVEFYSTGDNGPDDAMLARLPQESRFLRPFLQTRKSLLVFVVTRDAIHVEVLPLDMDRLAVQFFDQTQGRLLGISHDKQPLRAIRRWESLGRHLFTPILSHLSNCTHIFLVPHGLLHLLPLHALLSPLLGTSASTTMDRTTISYAPSASILTAVGITRARSLAQLDSLTVGVDRDRLSLSEWEAKTLAQRLDGRAVVGADATRSAILAALPNYHVIHFACHGYFNRQEPMNSGLAMTDENLTAAELLTLPPLHAELVTLSACDTALSELAYGDDPLGLPRAFIGAGARTLIATLWPIHEIPATLFMEAFYDRWQEGIGAATAFAHAQEYLRALDWTRFEQKLNDHSLAQDKLHTQFDYFTARLPGEHPFDHVYYWGAFLLIGCPD